MRRITEATVGVAEQVAHNGDDWRGKDCPDQSELAEGDQDDDEDSRMYINHATLDSRAHEPTHEQAYGNDDEHGGKRGIE